MKKLLLLCMALVFLINSEAYAKSLESANKNADVKKNFEIQFEYFNGKVFNNRNVNNYNVHVFQQFKQRRALSMYRGITFTRATGYSKPKGDLLDSEGVGIGPAFMLRWKQRVSGKLYATADFTGSLMFYNKAHPAGGRAYGFLWRVGPRFVWQHSEKDSVSLGYSVSHFSNGLRSHNPGYNGVGFTLNFQHQF